MNADFGSIAFLVIIGLVPVGMVVGIVIAIARKVGGWSGLKATCAREGWSYTRESQAGVDELTATLEPTLFAARRGRHRITSVASCTVDGVRMRVADYHLRSRTTASGSRGGGAYSLLVLERGEPGPEFMVHHRQNGALAAVAQRLAGDRLVSASVEGWSWALVSSDDTLKQYPHSMGLAKRLGEVTGPGDNVFFYPQLIVWSRIGALSRRTARLIPELASVLRQFH